MAVAVGLLAVLGVACSSRGVEVTGPDARATGQHEATEAVDEASGSVGDEQAGASTQAASAGSTALAPETESGDPSDAEGDVGQQEQQGGGQAVRASPGPDGAIWTVALPSHDHEAGPDNYNVSVLRADPELDGGCVWLEGAGGEPLAVRWPGGTTARFTPIAGGEILIELIRADGTVVATTGDEIGWSGGDEHEDPRRLERCHVGGEDNFVNVTSFDLHSGG